MSDFRFFRHKGTPTESEWVVQYTFQDRGILGNRTPRPVDACLMPLVPTDHWGLIGPLDSDVYVEVPASEVPDEVRQLAEARVVECPYHPDYDWNA